MGMQSKSTKEMFGVQLGQDFLCSGVWCPIDLESDCEIRTLDGKKEENNFVVRSIDCGTNAVHVESSSKVSMLRYYSHDGRSVHVPLLGFSPFAGYVRLGICLQTDVKFDQCFHCNRVFPEGMAFCETCDNLGIKCNYCDERCQRAGW